MALKVILFVFTVKLMFNKGIGEKNHHVLQSRKMFKDYFKKFTLFLFTEKIVFLKQK